MLAIRQPDFRGARGRRTATGMAFRASVGHRKPGRPHAWVLAVALFALPVVGCGGSNGSSVVQTPRCLRASDCTSPLVCIQGFCVQQCVQSVDCPSAERCIAATGGNICEPPERSTCSYTSECTIPLVCGIDQQCRNQCQANRDCPQGQVCTSVTKLCADPSIDTNYNPTTNDFNVTTDGGAQTTPGGGTVDGGGAVDAGAGADVSLAPPGQGGVDAAMGSGMDASVVDASLSLDGPALPVDGVVVSPSSSVRQGQIDITMTITRAAGGLASAGMFDLGDLTARMQSNSTDASLVLKVSVPHAAPFGKRTLRFATAAGVVTLPNVVEVTAITAGPTGADTNAGSAASPFLTLKQALLVADVGDTVHLMDGTYNIKGGETWGYVIPDNLTILGDSTAGTIIDGVGATNNPNGFNASTSLKLETLTLEHFYYGIDVRKPTTTLTLQDVQLSGNSSYGIYVEQTAAGSTVDVSGKNGLIDQPGQSAIVVYGASDVTVNLTDATLQGGGHVVYFVSDCSGDKLDVTGATIKQLGTENAIELAISSNATGSVATLNNATIVGNITDNDAKGSLAITGSNITQKAGDGIDFAGLALGMVHTTITMTTNSAGIYFNGTQATMSLSGVTVSGGGYGIHQTGAGSTAKLRGTTIQGTTYDAYLLAAGDLDLGTAVESGGNVIGAPTGTSYWCLNISRPQGASAGNPVTCSDTTLNGLAPSPGTIDATAGTVSLQPQRYYLSTGNKLIFY